MNAHVKRPHPDVDIPKGFTRNLRSSYTDLTPNPITQNEENCSCKYYNFVSFLINIGINIEKVKENINLLKRIDNFKKNKNLLKYLDNFKIYLKKREITL